MSSREQNKKQPVLDGGRIEQLFSSSLYIVALVVILAYLYQSFISNI